MLRAILIDDEVIALDVLEIVLEEVGGVQVVGKFQQITEVLGQVSGLQPDLVFLDIEMPGMSGLEAAEHLLGRHASMDIIFVTAHQEFAVEAFETGAFGYLLKPISKDKLAKTLDRYAVRLSRDLESRGLRQTSVDFPTDSEEMGRLHLNVLGSMELYGPDRQLVTWRTKKTKELFAYLWHHNGTPAYRYRLLDDLWPDSEPERSQKLLNTTIYNLRNALKNTGFPDMVAFADERYWLKIENIDSDAAKLEEFMTGRRSHEISELLSLYRGDYFEAEHYGWAVNKSYELHSSYTQSLEQWLGKVSGTDKELVWRKLIELEPYQERYYDLLLLHLEKTGDAVAAGKLLELKRQRIEEELGL